jgi:multimeric flavodoxin WrbA
MIQKFSKQPKIVIIQASPRSENNCPNQKSKTSKIVEHVINKYNFRAEFSLIDLSLQQDKAIIQPCKGCISTAGGYHCHFSCDCYSKGNNDLMYELDVYNKLKECDSFIIFSPIHWYSLPSQLKALFDRLVCINQTLTVEDAEKILGENKKNSNYTGKLSQEGLYDNLLKNHLEGKIAGFYVHGDAGANDYSHKNLPQTYSKIEDNLFENDAKNCIKPFILQLKYSGIEVPDELVEVFFMNKGLDYYTANEILDKDKFPYELAEKLIEKLIVKSLK